jgi:import inner membrane translocase subunit TIM9
MYSNLVQKCFEDCVNDFTTKSLHSKEEGCVMRCVDKFLKTSERVGQRFAEQNATMMSNTGAGPLGR